jgi:hypothetical protein
MEVWHLPNDFWTAMEKGVLHIINHKGTTNIIPLPFTVSAHHRRMKLWEASKQQFKIGWINVLKGRLSIRWQDYVTAHLKATKSRHKADEWATNSSQRYGNIHYGYGTWIMRCGQNDTN